MFKIHNHSCCNDMFSLACQQQIPKKLRLVPLKLYLSFEGLDFHILGTLGVYCLLVCSFYEVYIMFLLTDEQLEKIRAKAEAEETRIGGASFGWNKETGEFEITNEDKGHPISEFEVFI